MRTSTGLCLLACGAALAACTAAPPKGPDTTVSTPSVGRPPPPASAQAAVSAEAFTPYAALGASSNDGLAPGESSDALAGECMTAEGWPGVNVVDIVGIQYGGGLVNVSPPQPWGGWGYLGAADAQQYGFNPSAAFTSLPAGAQAAAGKCGTIVQDFSNATVPGPLAGIYTLGRDISTDVQDDPAVEAATRAWSACMAKNGYSFRQPWDVIDQELRAMFPPNSSAPVSPSAQQAQIAAAVTDADCTQAADLAGIYFAVQASYEQQLVTANQQALNAAVREFKANYARELNKLPALLRTTPATLPPPPGAAHPGGPGHAGTHGRTHS
jgi:hypothetical protein